MCPQFWFWCTSELRVSVNGNDLNELQFIDRIYIAKLYSWKWSFAPKRQRSRRTLFRECIVLRHNWHREMIGSFVSTEFDKQSYWGARLLRCWRCRSSTNSMSVTLGNNFFVFPGTFSATVGDTAQRGRLSPCFNMDPATFNWHKPRCNMNVSCKESRNV